MPVDFEICRQWNFVWVSLRGDVTGAEHVQSFVDYSRHPDFDGAQHVLMNLRDFEFRNVFFKELMGLATELQSHYQMRAATSRTAIFAPTDTAYGMSRMFQSMTEGNTPSRVGVFRTMDEAMSFIDITPTSPASLWVEQHLSAPH
ncbi:hypothetical protein [Tropicibacter alexandrii]|uniref:hypothetical protein n=1 Tax=Tropicibacter alexandrii TaxID=2267683 RepID=UPI000EF47D04|nr:hypothetical protein [Tropicibacter alexandrii]